MTLTPVTSDFRRALPARFRSSPRPRHISTSNLPQSSGDTSVDEHMPTIISLCPSGMASTAALDSSNHSVDDAHSRGTVNGTVDLCVLHVQPVAVGIIHKDTPFKCSSSSFEAAGGDSSQIEHALIHIRLLTTPVTIPFCQ